MHKQPRRRDDWMEEALLDFALSGREINHYPPRAKRFRTFRRDVLRSRPARIYAGGFV